jgi:hypothetical protein
MESRKTAYDFLYIKLFTNENATGARGAAMDLVTHVGLAIIYVLNQTHPSAYHIFKESKEILL